MPATSEQIEAALLAPFVPLAEGGLGEWTSTSYVAFENVDFDINTVGTTPWIAVEANAGLKTTSSIGFEVRGVPTVTVSAFVPMGQGKSAARAIIDAAIGIYEARQFSAGNSTIVPYSFSRPVQLPDQNWYKLAIQISFNLF